MLQIDANHTGITKIIFLEKRCNVIKNYLKFCHYLKSYFLKP